MSGLVRLPELTLEEVDALRSLVEAELRGLGTRHGPVGSKRRALLASLRTALAEAMYDLERDVDRG